MVAYHPPAEYLCDYAAGTACEAVSVLIATHLALCPQCRRQVSALDHLGGVMLEDLPPASLSHHAPELPTFKEPADILPPQLTANWPVEPSIPEPLRSYLAMAAKPPVWRWRLPGLSEMAVAVMGENRRSMAHLMRIPAGRAMPRHKHFGHELTLVLSGGFSDETGHYERGDIGYADFNTDHRPIADRGAPCICFVVMDAPLKLTGPLGRMINWAFGTSR